MLTQTFQSFDVKIKFKHCLFTFKKFPRKKSFSGSFQRPSSFSRSNFRPVETVYLFSSLLPLTNAGLCSMSDYNNCYSRRWDNSSLYVTTSIAWYLVTSCLIKQPQKPGKNVYFQILHSRSEIRQTPHTNLPKH